MIKSRKAKEFHPNGRLERIEKRKKYDYQMCQGIRESRNHGPSPQTIVMMIVFYQIQATCKS